MRLSGDFFFPESVQENRFVVRLNAAHYIYAAHFPGHPVTPGVCLVQMVQELLSQSFGCPLFTRTIRNVKFLNIVSPLENERVAVCITRMADDGSQVSVQAVITADADDSRVFAKMSLVMERTPF